MRGVERKKKPDYRSGSSPYFFAALRDFFFLRIAIGFLR
jgi:hypothetical protein